MTKITKMTIGIFSLLTALNVSATTLTCDESVGNFKGSKLTLELNDKNEIERFSFESASGNYIIKNEELTRNEDEADGTQNYVYSGTFLIKYFPSKNDMELVQYNIYTPNSRDAIKRFKTVECSKN